jgi:hypothetical protein
MGRLIEVHEVHVDLCPGEIAVELGVRWSSGFCRTVSPAIHILAGENVCIQAMTPTQL